MSEYTIIPKPVSIVYRAGNFLCNGIPVVKNPEVFQSEAEVFSSQLKKTWGDDDFSRDDKFIRLEKTPEGEAEAYHLEIQPDGIILRASAGAGIFRGFQTLRQLFLSEFQENSLSIHCGIIEDKPRFSWRGFMLDSSRYFYSVEFIKKLLDTLSLQHINFFHWHLTDDQGWRLPVEKYPLLTEIGSRRQDSRDHYYYKGGFYTETEIRDIVSYAAERHIEVVPEVDLPGHTSAILAAYPGLGCTGGPYRVEERYGIREDVLCAGNDEIFTLIEAIFDSLVNLFPSKYVHIGGDEVLFNRWTECPKCQKRLTSLGLKDPAQIQSWITFRLAEMLHERGRTAIGWDEVLDDSEQFPLPENMIVMSWRGQEGGTKAVSLGRQVIMSPLTGGCYLDYKNFSDPEEPGQLGISTIAQGYNMEPVTPQMGDAASLVMGGQGNLWSEIIYAGKIAEYMIFPRICAIAETLWSEKEQKDFKDFSKRLKVHQNRLDKLGILQYRGPLG
jgi:hexosaminidase